MVWYIETVWEEQCFPWYVRQLLFLTWKTLVVPSNMWLVILRLSQFWHREWWLVRVMWHHVTFLPAECAQRLMRNVNYEIPALKQQIAKCHQTQRVWYTVHPPDVIHKMNTTKPFISLFYFHVLFQHKGQGVINGEAWERTTTIPSLQCSLSP